MTEFVRERQALVNTDKNAFTAAKARREGIKRIDRMEAKINSLEAAIESLERTVREMNEK